MDNERSGMIIRDLRISRGMTQKQLADAIGVSDKAVSKWETGMGAPDISVVGILAAELGVSADVILSGSLGSKEESSGNMNRMNFYVCPECGNVMAASGSAEVTCCGRKVPAMNVKEAKPADDGHRLEVSESDGELYITFSHEMTKEHYIGFVCAVRYDRFLMVQMFPEQSSELRMPDMRKCKLYFWCSRDGLFLQ
mgnify:CR=1 FL=1